MNAPATIETARVMAYAERECSFEARRKFVARAEKIVDRVLPEPAKVHGFADPEAWLSASRRRGQRRILYWEVFARLRAKANGGLPRIKLPKGTDALDDTAMARAAQNLIAKFPAPLDPDEAYAFEPRVMPAEGRV